MSHFRMVSTLATTVGGKTCLWHYDDVIMGTIASQITSLTIVYSTVYSDADQRKHQSSASLAFVWGIHPGQMASNAENVSIWWRHYGDTEYSSNIEMPLKWEWIAVPAPREPKLDFLISPLWHLRCMSHKHRFGFISENIHCSTFMSTPNHIKNCVWKNWSLILARVMHLCI